MYETGKVLREPKLMDECISQCFLTISADDPDSQESSGDFGQ